MTVWILLIVFKSLPLLLWSHALVLISMKKFICHRSKAFTQRLHFTMVRVRCTAHTLYLDWRYHLWACSLPLQNWNILKIILHELMAPVGLRIQRQVDWFPVWIIFSTYKLILGSRYALIPGGRSWPYLLDAYDPTMPGGAP